MRLRDPTHTQHTGMATPHRRHCDDCDEDYDTRDRLCPTCGAAFALASTTSSAQADADRAEQERRRNLEAWLEGIYPGDETEEEMQQRIARMLSQGFGAGGGEGGPGRNGLSDEDIARLPLSQLHTTSSMLMSVTMTLNSSDGQPPLAMECIPGAFSPVPPEGSQFNLVQADPLLADKLPLQNQEACRGKVIVTQRGKQTFGAMLVEARRAGALGVVVVNSVPLWPYLMRDGKGEARLDVGKEEGKKEEEEKEEKQQAACFIVMVNQAQGGIFNRRLAADAANTRGSFAVSKVEKECLICITAFAEDETILSLPCKHAYHAECAKRWLALQKTCPACRMEVKPRRDDA